MSTATRGVAVAVAAKIERAPSACATSPRRKYSGRKSWPHWLTQWASSTTKSPISAARRRSTKPGVAEALRRDVEHLDLAGERALERSRLSAGSRWALISSARPPRPSTWSCISETSGETTTASRRSSSAGSW